MLMRWDHRFGILLFACVLASVARPALAESTEWSQWRGPAHDGIYPDEQKWSVSSSKAGPRPAWKVAVGTGYATVAVSRGRVYAVGHPEGPDDVVSCIDDQTGKPVWTRRYPQDLVAIYNAGGPNATPVVDGQWLYVFSKQGLLTCFDKADGRVRWQRDLLREEGVTMPMWGFASTPLVVGDRLYLNANESGVAVNKDTGSVIWKSKAESSGYASVVAARFRDEDCLAVLGTRELFVVRQSDGNQVWRALWPTKMGENSADPIAVGDKVYVSSWWGMGAALFDLTQPADQPVWVNKDFQNHIAAPVLFEGHLYGFDGPVHRRTQKIALRCVDFKTGLIQWSQPGMVGSLVVADRKLIILTNEGELVVAEANPTGYEEISRAKLVGAKSWAPPVLHRGRLYLRDGENIYCFELPKK
jgi:outer membrane protein assembly factor BamB